MIYWCHVVVYVLDLHFTLEWPWLGRNGYYNKSILQYLWVLYEPNLHQLLILTWSTDATWWFMSLTYISRFSDPRHKMAIVGAPVMVPITILSSWSKFLFANSFTGCGQRLGGPLMVQYIIHGNDASPRAWPWQASIQLLIGSEYTHICGGSLLSGDFVISAAHCTLWVQYTHICGGSLLSTIHTYLWRVASQYDTHISVEGQFSVAILSSLPLTAHCEYNASFCSIRYTPPFVSLIWILIHFWQYILTSVGYIA